MVGAALVRSSFSAHVDQVRLDKASEEGIDEGSVMLALNASTRPYPMTLCPAGAEPAKKNVKRIIMQEILVPKTSTGYVWFSIKNF